MATLCAQGVENVSVEPISSSRAGDNAHEHHDLIDERPDNPLLAPLRFAVHQGRLLGYMPLVLWSLFRSPKRTLQGVAAYYALRLGSSRWCEFVRGLLACGSSRRPKLIRAQSKPFDTSKQYLLCAHPHGILNGGWWNLISRYGLRLVDGLELTMCVAPAVQWYPLYGELFEDRVTDASKRTIERILQTTRLTPCLIPGGFSEATYTNADPNVEYAYIADRLGFIRIAIEQGVDIIPSCAPHNTTLRILSHTNANARIALALPARPPQTPLGSTTCTKRSTGGGTSGRYRRRRAACRR